MVGDIMRHTTVAIIGFHQRKPWDSSVVVGWVRNHDELGSNHSGGRLP